MKAETVEPGAMARAWRSMVRFNGRFNRLYWRYARSPSQLDCYGARLQRYLKPGQAAVYLGAGGKDYRSFLPEEPDGAGVCAVDCSLKSIRRNPARSRVVAWAHDMPFREGTVDLIFSEYLMEHVEDPRGSLAEMYRVLRPGGTVLWIAPNLWSYQGLATKLTPFGFHLFVNKLLEPVTRRRASADVFPTYLRINSIPRIKRDLRDAGFELVELCSITDPPHYTQMLPLVHQLAVLLHITLDRLSFLQHFRMVQVVTARKPA